MSMSGVIIVPRELVFTDVSPDTRQKLSFIIKSREAVQLEFVEYDTSVFEIKPTSVSLNPHQEQLIHISLKAMRFDASTRLKDIILIRNKETRQTIQFPVTIQPSSHLFNLSPNLSQNQDELGMSQNGDDTLLSLGSQRDASNLLGSSYRESNVGGLSSVGYRDNQVLAYKRIIDEKDKLIEKLESEMLIAKESYENLKVELSSAKEVEKINSKMSSLLKETSPNVSRAVEIALQRERIEHERQNQKVFELFQEKDNQIQSKDRRIQENDKLISEIESDRRKLRSRVHELESLLQDERDEVRERIRSLENELEGCVRENNSTFASSQNQVLRDLENLQQEIRGYKMQLEDRHNHACLLASELELANNRIQEQEQLSAEESHLIEELKHQNIELSNQIQEFIQKERYWQEYYERKSAESRDLSDRVDDYKALQEDIHRMTQSNQALIDEKDAQIDDLSRQVFELSQQNSQYQNQRILNQQRSDDQYDPDLLEEPESRVPNFANSSSLRAKDLSHSPIAKMNAHNQEKIIRLESELEQMSVALQLAQNQLNEERTQKKLLTEKMNFKIAEADRVHNQLVAHLKSETDAKTELTQKVDQLSSQLSSIERQKKQVDEELQKAKANSPSIQSSDDQNNGQLNLLKLKNEQLEKKEARLTDENHRMEDLYNDLLKEFNALKSELVRLRQIESNQDRNQGEDSAESERVVMQQTIQELESAIEKYEDSELTSRKKIIVLERENDNLASNANHLTQLIDDLEYKAKEVEDRYRADLIEIQKKNIELQGTIYQLEKEIDRQRDLLQKSDFLKEKIEITSKVNQKFESDIKENKLRHQEEMQGLRHELECCENSKADLERTLEEYKHDNQILLKNSEDNELIVKKLSDESEELDHRNQLLMVENQKINELNRKYGIEIERIHAQLNTSKDQTDWAERKRIEAESNLHQNSSHHQELLKREQDEKIVLKRELQMEIEKIIRVNEDNIFQLKIENQELSDKLMIEIEEKQRDNELWIEKEAALHQQIKFLQHDVEKIHRRQKSSSKHRGSEDHNDVHNASGASRKRANSNNRSTDQVRSGSNNAHNESLGEIDLETDRVQLMRKYEVEIQNKNLQILKERQSLEALRANLRRIEAAKEALQNENYQLRTSVRDSQREKEDLIREMNVLQIQTKHTDPADAKVIEELHDLRETMRRILLEKERLFSQLQLEDPQEQSEKVQRVDIFKFMKQVELKYRALESDANNEILSNKQSISSLNQDVFTLKRDVKDLTQKLEKREEECLLLMEEMKEAKADSSRQKEIADNATRDQENLKLETSLLLKAKDDQITSIQQELAKQEEAVGVMRDEMMNQNKAFKEMKGSQEGSISIMKQKFISDLQEIYSKFNAFVSQAQQESKKGGSGTAATTNIRDDKKYITRLLETYAENVNVVSHKEAMLKKLQDKEKKMIDKEKSLTKEVERLNEINKKIAEEFQLAQKKGYTVSAAQKKGSGLRSGSQSFQNILAPISELQAAQKKSQANLSQNDISVSYINNEGTTADQQGKGTLKLKDIATLEAQLFTSKNNLEQAQEEITFHKDYTKDLKEDIEKLQKREEELIEESRVLQVKLNEQQRIQKADKEKFAADLEIVKQQYFTPESYNELKTQIEVKDKQIKELKDDVNRKKDLVQSVKQLKEEQSYDLKTLQVEIERLQKELEKYKIRANKATTALVGPSKEIKTQIENAKTSEKKLIQENEELNEKLKASRTEVARANATIKDLRSKLEQLQQNSEQLTETTESLEKAKEQVKKLKADLDRKETTSKSMKQKFDAATSELEDLKALAKSSITRSEFVQEQKKADQFKSTLKKTEAQTSMLVFLLKRIFRESFVNLQKAKSNQAAMYAKPTRDRPMGSSSANKFSDSVNILGLSPDEIDMFIDPYASSNNRNTQSQASQASEFYCDLMDRFEKELENIDENINVNSLYNMLFSVIEERVELARHSK